ncbi:MAG: rod shape-determining protein MreC [Candidatus Moranbacteria bacterium CG2_30_41_165]|nr:MAG: rod shape-determining protein MreC [Candidatus Moranbacteria bacterium CG2_30_41_165]
MNIVLLDKRYFLYFLLFPFMSVRQSLTKTKLFRALMLFCLVFLVVHFGPPSFVKPVRFVAMTIVSPIQKMTSFVAFKIQSTYEFFSSIGDLKRENERLEKERLNLLAENVRYADVVKDNDELRKEIGLLPRNKFSLKASTVIGRDISGMGSFLLIDKGSLDGIASGMSVIVGNGILVGKIGEVFPASARVILLSNPESLMSGITLDTDAKGIVKGEYGLGLLFDMVLQTDVLKAGSTIVTSGLGGDVPRGLLIGTLQEPRLSSDRLFQQASILSPIRFDRIHYVFVIQEVL